MNIPESIMVPENKCCTASQPNSLLHFQALWFFFHHGLKSPKATDEAMLFTLMEEILNKWEYT